MRLPVFVELLTPDGDVKARHKCTHLPIRIGRAYDNDIILDDPHTAAHHAQIELNQLDEWVISDLGSHNGITLENTREHFFVIDGEQSYRLGRTRLRVRALDYAVAPEIADSTNHRWEGWRPALSGLGLLIITATLSTWLSDLNESTFSKYLLELVSVIGLAMAWSGIWGLFSKLFTGHARFGRHFFIVSCGLALLELWNHLSGILAFAFSWELLATFSNHPVIFICATVLYFHLLTTGNKRPQRLKLYLAGIAAIVSAIIMTKQYQASNHLADDLYMGNIYPPALRISHDHSRDEFIAQVNTLKDTVDKARKENPEKDGSTQPGKKAPAPSPAPIGPDTDAPGAETPDAETPDAETPDAETPESQ